MTSKEMEKLPAASASNGNDSGSGEHDMEPKLESFADVMGAGRDEDDMYRLGRVQEVKRRFRYFSIAGYIVILGDTWEAILIGSVLGLANGGTAGLIWSSIGCCIGMGMCVLSMAELASMAPTSGGQYHWVSEIAPPKLQKTLSYAVGWLAALGWQMAMPAVGYVVGLQLMALISVCDETYVPQGWHGALFTMASAFSACILSIFVMQRLNLAEGFAVTLHIFGFIAIVAILWVMGPSAPAEEVFFGFQNGNGWANSGVATLVAIIAPVGAFIGGDSAVHLAEELQDASYVLPRAMVAASVLNYVTGLVVLITLMFNLGTIDDEILRYGGQPWVAVVYRITGSKAATIVLILVVALNLYCLQINQVMTSSRQLWAFARDKGVPFHRFLAKVGSNGIPRNAVVVTMAFTCVVALIVIGSGSAFAIILSFGNAGLYGSYLIVLGCLVWRRIVGPELPKSNFTLGKWGLPINLLGFCYLWIVFIFIFFPPEPEPTLNTMNWTCVLFSGIMVVAFSWYLIRGRKEYDGPVEYVRKNL